jgi:hypothetical protein
MALRSYRGDPSRRWTGENLYSQLRNWTSVTVRFYLRDVMMGTLAACVMLGTFCVMPYGFQSVSLVLLPFATGWHVAENDWLSCVLSGALGALAMYLSVGLIAISPTWDLGSFPQATFLFAGPTGFLVGFVIGAVARVIRRAAERLLLKPVGMTGPRWVLVWITLGYSIAVAGALSSKL